VQSYAAHHDSKRNPHLTVIHWDGRTPSMNRLSRFKTLRAAFQTCARRVGTIYCMISVSRASAEHQLLYLPKTPRMVFCYTIPLPGPDPLAPPLSFSIRLPTTMSMSQQPILLPDPKIPTRTPTQTLPDLSSIPQHPQQNDQTDHQCHDTKVRMIRPKVSDLEEHIFEGANG
jgi:hypothetical protein